MNATCILKGTYTYNINNKHLRWFPQNIQAIMAKIKLPKNPHSMVMFWIKVRRTYRDLSSQADPMRKNWTWSYPHFNKNGRFMIFENTITHSLSIRTRFDIKFLENAWEFNHGVTWRNELQWDVLKSIEKVIVLWVDF